MHCEQNQVLSQSWTSGGFIPVDGIYHATPAYGVEQHGYKSGWWRGHYAQAAFAPHVNPRRD